MNAPTEENIIRDTRIWLEKAVIGLNFCPFAKAPYAKNSVRIAVSNAGQPLSSDALHALFDPLRRGSLPAHKGEHASLGLGLFLVREIAIAHGGDVAAHVGEGVTTFVIHLPRGDSPAA